MANEKVTVKKETGNNLTPVIIIGAILLATVLGIYMIMNSGDKETAQQSPGNAGQTEGNSGQIPNYNSAPPGASPSHFKGSDSAAVMLEEFADFQCPTCRVVHPKINEIISKYGSRVKVVFRNYPLTNMHPKAYDASVAAEAAGLQGKFWEMQNIIFNNQPTWSNSPNHKQEFEKYAQTIGLDIDRYKNDVLGMNAKMRVDADINRGRALNITSTPTIILNGRIIPHPQVEVATLSQLIDAELAKLESGNDSGAKPEEVSAEKKTDEANK